MKKILDTPISIADEYHLESSNKLISIEMPSAHQINYDEKIFELVKNSPLSLGDDDETSSAVLDSKQSKGLNLLIDGESASMALEESICSRVSTRDFSTEPISFAKLSKLLYLANGVRKTDTSRIHSRNNPSAGNLGSVEIYCFILNVTGVEPGIYHFNTVNHDLCLLNKGHFAEWMKQFAFYQQEASEPAVVIALTSNVGRLKSKYGERGYRLGLLDTGHVSQNIYLTATALGLGVFAFGGFVDEEVNRALDLDGLDQCTFLCLGVGAL